MKYSPDFAAFSRLAQGVLLVPVYRRLLGDTLTPVSAFHKIDFGPTACLFESVIGGEKVGRYSFLAADPFLQLEARGNQVTIVSADGTQEFQSDDPLAELKQRQHLRAASDELSQLEPLPRKSAKRAQLCAHGFLRERTLDVHQ